MAILPLLIPHLNKAKRRELQRILDVYDKLTPTQRRALQRVIRPFVPAPKKKGRA